MSLFSDVLVKPTEISFVQSAANTLSPVEVLVLNKSRKALRYKVLCTAHLNYSLSKCKGVLEPGSFIKIIIEVIQPVREHTRRDFFKIQFFSCSDDSLQVNKASKLAALPATQPSPPKASLQGFGYLHHLLHFVAFTICLAGISLPMLTQDLNGLLHWALSTDAAKQQTQISVPTDICQLHTGPYSSRPCTSCTDETYRNSYSEDDRSYRDDFSRHSHLAVLSFKAAFANICGALRTMNALTVITNLSWFFLGLLVMHTRRRNL
ncbi:hypothetical protein P879_06106 [Paragonimus westermani]|uniref:MSP domain-containing protein n=1 Tax=Paragonimus westermani TaxID=34504 RepID=A0A8T0DKC8_9TREM|nr:hypothetical protein P879_06106 [Paragonimus westermani]